MTVGALCAETVKTLWLHGRVKGVTGTLNSHNGQLYMLGVP